MSEHLPSNREHREAGPKPYGDSVNDYPEHKKHSSELPKQVQERDIDQIIKNIEQEARPSHEIKQDQEEQVAEHRRARGVGRSTVNHRTAEQTLLKVQKNLPPIQRQFSRVVHNPVIETVSNIAGGTVARPSGLLSAGVFSLISSLVVVMICRFYGYEYNFVIGMAFFVLGFLVGLAIEFLIKLLKSHPKT